jgi:ABC-type antimicrobial peptide transport system permease subunit
VTAGRDFRDSDKEGSGRVVIVSQKLAQTLFPGQNAVNHELRWTDGVMKFIGISMEPRRIVGVVPDFDDENIIPSPEMMVYEPADQEGWNGRLLVNVSAGDPYSLAPAIRRTIHDISAEQPVERISTLKDIRAEVMVPDKLNAVVFGGFALVALLISVVGVAGVLAFSVSSRTREFGIRMALGAKPRDILQDVLRQGVRMATIGVIAGVILGIVFARGLGHYITEVQLPGTPAFLISGFVMLAAAVIASAVPAARAARVNAMEALRAE